MKQRSLLVVLFIKYSLCLNLRLEHKLYGGSDIRRRYGGDLSAAIVDIVDGFPSQNMVLSFNNEADADFVQHVAKKLQKEHISVNLFNLTTIEMQEKYFTYISRQTSNHYECYTVFIGNHKLYEHLLLEIFARNFIRRNIVYVFYWGAKSFSRFFLENIHYSMKVYVITNPRNDTFRLYYSQTQPRKSHHLHMVNWWNEGKGLFNHPTLPINKSVFKNFEGRVFQVPVLHKPPWHFVKYGNSTGPSVNSIEVLGGRDDRILSLLSQKLNFRYNYFDPPERVEGTLDPDSGMFNGVIGLIWRREADLFIGDVALTYERPNFVEFSFITLADSGAFVTHAPSRLNEALALLRPFQWQVWPAIGITFLAVGPVLYAIVALPNLWQPRFRVRSQCRLFFDCTWFTVTILLKQTGREPCSSHKARFFIILLSISATYVITDMYSANLTSLLAKPGREKPIHNLYQLENAIKSRDYKLFVEKHSSSYALLENGTGIYARLWNLMEKNQDGNYFVDSVEKGVKMVKDTTKNAVMGGRETLYFDIHRFGPSNFHLSEKLNTAYSAIALQLGCPFIEEINNILMAIFEAGIITKMTENEYKKLGQQKELTSDNLDMAGVVTKKESRRQVKAEDDNEKLMPINIKMLQGTFYLLLIGNVFSGVILLAEILFHHHKMKFNPMLQRMKTVRVYVKLTRSKVKHFYKHMLRVYRYMRQEAFISTLEYLD